MDTRLLSKKIYNKGINEILKIKKVKNKAKNLEEQILATFGKTFTKYIFEPVIKKKSFKCNLNNLDINTHHYFGLGRVLAFNSEESKKIKKNKIYDKKFSFHSYEEGQSQLSSYYPKQGGSEEWIRLLKKQLVELGVKIITNTKVTKIIHKNKKVDSIILDEKKKNKVL